MAGKQAMSLHFRSRLLIVVVMAALSPAALAASPEQAADLDEVVVNGAQLDQVKKELLEAEDRFFRRYNELNTDNEFDIQCQKEARVGTRLKKRYCRANFEEKALVEEGQETGKIFQSIQDQFRQGASNPVVQGGALVPGFAVMEMRRPAFRLHMKEVVSSHPELIELLKQHAALIDRYNELRTKLFTSTP
jgi:glycosyltransferase A (GT-A) superfamily protein (DUF2064 family)